MYRIEEATERDIEKIIDLIHPAYFLESAWSSFTPDREAAREYISSFDLCLVGKDRYANIIAVASLAVHKTYFAEPFGALSLFYVPPEWRGTGLSRDLVSTLTRKADEIGVRAILADSISGKDAQLFANLFKKFGYRQIGVTMVRGIE